MLRSCDNAPTHRNSCTQIWMRFVSEPQTGSDTVSECCDFGSWKEISIRNAKYFVWIERVLLFTIIYATKQNNAMRCDDADDDHDVDDGCVHTIHSYAHRARRGNTFIQEISTITGAISPSPPKLLTLPDRSAIGCCTLRYFVCPVQWHRVTAHIFSTHIFVWITSHSRTICIHIDLIIVPLLFCDRSGGR